MSKKEVKPVRTQDFAGHRRDGPVLDHADVYKRQVIYDAMHFIVEIHVAHVF